LRSPRGNEREARPSPHTHHTEICSIPLRRPAWRELKRKETNPYPAAARPGNGTNQKPRRNLTKLHSAPISFVPSASALCPPPSRLPLRAQPRSASSASPMAASLLHAAGSSSPRAGGPSPPGPAAAFRPLASSPFLRLARSSPDPRRRCRIGSSLRALPAGTRLAAGGPAPRARRAVVAFAEEEPVSTRPLRDPSPDFRFLRQMPCFDF
jgi:hypothetical protein